MADLKITVVGDEIHCQITPAVDLKSPVFCFSLMVRPTVLRGGTLIRTLGGYGEISLPDLHAGCAHMVVVAYADANTRPVNRAWLPLGPHLRHAGGLIELPPGPAGAVPWSAPHKTKPPNLALCPPPNSFVMTGEISSLTQLKSDHFQLQLVDRLAQRLELNSILGSNGSKTIINLDQSMSTAAYRIDIDNAVTITAGDEAGIFYAGISLLNLINGQKGQVPNGCIEDSPRFEWRGQHLDCARHYYQPDTILRYLDLMALLKLNRFHWHFADDEAFRLELESCPEVWQKSAFRGALETIPGVFGGGLRAGGRYSKAFVRELVAHANSLHIEVMPEIEVPGHSYCLTTILPELRDPHDTSRERCVQDYEGNTMNPALPATWAFLDAVTFEISELFPFQYMHLGCDELASGAWERSPKIDALKLKEDLQTSDDVCGWMMERLAKKVEDFGKTPAAWEEAARGKNGGIGHNALLFSWSGQGPGLDAAKAGYDVVMTPAQHVYLDMAATDDPDDWGAAWAAFVSLEDTLNWDPVPESLGKARHKIKGVQGCFWSEFTTQDDQIWPMIWPRLLGVATCAWSSDIARSKADITALACAYSWANPGRLT